MAPSRPTLRLLRDAFPDRPALGTGVSDAILRRVAAGELGPTFRLHRPARELAFSKQDLASSGFHRAAAAARARGFEPVVRLAGGRAAAFHEGTLAFSWATPSPEPARTTRARFAEAAELICAALRRLAVDARIGEVAGEYCPGAWSVNARGAVKLAGIGQRLISGGAHVGGVVVVSDSPLLRSALAPVYEALGLEWDEATAGAVEDEAGKVGLDDAEDAIVAELERRHRLLPDRVDGATLALARTLQPRHSP